MGMEDKFTTNRALLKRFKNLNGGKAGVRSDFTSWSFVKWKKNEFPSPWFSIVFLYPMSFSCPYDHCH